MKILVAAPVKDRAWAIPHWSLGIQASTDVPVDVLALLSESEDDTEGVLDLYDVEIVHDYAPGRPVHEIDGHQWGLIERYEYMARLRNKIVEIALERDVDYLFSLDTDIVMPPKGLTRMLEFARTHSGVIAPAVNMATGQVAWNVMNWSDRSAPGMVNRERPTFPGRVDVVMAAMLLDRDALRCRWHAHMAGEDVGFCLDAEEKGINRWWMSDVRCQHLMQRIS